MLLVGELRAKLLAVLGLDRLTKRRVGELRAKLLAVLGFDRLTKGRVGSSIATVVSFYSIWGSAWSNTPAVPLLRHLVLDVLVVARCGRPILLLELSPGWSLLLSDIALLLMAKIAAFHIPKGEHVTMTSSAQLV